MTNIKKYRVGLDISSIAWFCLLEGNKIISICQVPQKTENKELSRGLTNLKKDAKIKGNKTKCEKEIKLINNKILNLPRDCKRVFEWLSKYKDEIEIVNIEKPLMQTFGATSIISLTRMSEYLGIITCMLDILDIPYKVYYFSCNLEHVLHNEQNLPQEEKGEFADVFSEKFYGKPQEFIDFICDKEFAVEGSYVETWNFIKQDTHSLKRYTNFQLFFDEDK